MRNSITGASGLKATTPFRLNPPSLFQDDCSNGRVLIPLLAENTLNSQPTTMLDSAFLMLGQAEIVINWFTPVWIVALGISLGFLVAMLFVGLVYLISMIPGLNQIGVKSKSFWIAGTITTVLLLAAANRDPCLAARRFALGICQSTTR